MNQTQIEKIKNTPAFKTPEAPITLALVPLHMSNCTDIISSTDVRNSENSHHSNTNNSSSEKTKAKEYLMRMILKCGVLNEKYQPHLPLNSAYSKRNWNDLYSPLEKRTIKTLCPQCEMQPIAEKMLTLDLFPTKGKIATIRNKQLNAKQFDWLCLNKPGICPNYVNFDGVQHKKLFHEPLVINKQIMLFYMRSISFDDENNDYQKPNFVVSVVGHGGKHENHKILIKAVKKSTFKRNCQPKV